VLLTPNLHDTDGLGLIQQLTVDLPSVYIIILSRQSDAQYLQAAMLAGAKAFLSQPAPAEPLIAAIRAGS
jgi:DNA-binding NarL/FixJ family response regulator